MSADFEIVGLVSRGQDRADSSGTRRQTPEFGDYADALAAHADAVCISTYAETHAEYAIAASSGRARLVEKPLADSMAAAGADRAARRAKRRWSPATSCRCIPRGRRLPTSPAHSARRL